nr:DUF5688 family protein [uncultured Acetatifactor sp.]
MNIKEFTEQIRAALAVSLNKEVQLKETLKLNNIRRYGIVIVESENSLSPIIYLEKLFEDFRKGTSMDAVLGTVICIYKQGRPKKPVSMEWIEHFDQARETIFYFLINYDANQEFLAQVPHFRYLDLAVVFGMKSGLENTPGTITVFNNHLDMWGVTAEDLFPIAEANTPRLYPLQVSCMPDFVLGKTIPGHPSQMYILTNSYHTYGAAAIRYKDALKGFSLLMGRDVLLLPDSIHQMVLLPLEEGENPGSYRDMVRSANENYTEISQFLSNSVYLYKRDTGEIEAV